jgi:hypothetical protein
MNDNNQFKSARPISASTKRPDFFKFSAKTRNKYVNKQLTPRSEMPTIYLNPHSRKISQTKLPNQSCVDTEKIAEECIHLKCTVNNLTKELAFYKQEVHKREREINGKNKVLNDIYSDSQNNFMKDNNSDTKLFQRLRDNNLHANMRRQYKDLKGELKTKEGELEHLKRTLKSTKILELQGESEVYIEELKKLRVMYEIASKHSADYE